MINSLTEAMGVSILGLAETNINWNIRNTQNRCKRAMQSNHAHKFQFSSCIQPSDNSLSSYLPGGTMMIAYEPWTSRATSCNDKSNMGRWSEITLHGKQNLQITIITAYRACENHNTSHDDTTYYNQQWRHMFEAGTPDPSPRDQILSDLEIRMQELNSQGSEVIIMIDANESTRKHNSKLATWVHQNKLIDILLLHHGDNNEPATYKRGSQRIDYIFTTPTIANYITTSGILPFNEIGKGDHRSLFIDVDATRYLQDKPHQCIIQQQRGVSTNNPLSIKTYRRKLTEFLTTSKFLINMETLQKSINFIDGPLPSKIEQEYNRLDKWFTSTCLKIEKECSQIPSTPWSPALAAAKQLECYWSIWVSELQTGTELSKQRKRIQNTLSIARIKKLHKQTTIQIQLQLPNETPSLTNAHKALRNAKAEVRQITKDATTHRDEHLKKRAFIAMEDNNSKLEHIINNMRHIEAQRISNNKLRSLFKPNRKGGITHIIKDNPDGTTSKIYDRDEIFDRIIERNKKHFSQAEGTPFTTPTMKNLLGPYATSHASKQILDGTFNIHLIITTQATKDILSKCKRITPAGTIDCTITTNDVRYGMKAWRESTSTSPSKLHLGHAKALFKHDNCTDLQQKPALTTSLSETVFNFQAQLMNNAIQHNFAPERWNQVHNIMLEKQPGYPYLPKLRTIHITEKDENLLAGITFGRRLISHGEMIQAFGDEQGGSRPDRQTGEISLFKHFMLSISRTTITDLITFDNDAKSCYDRIIMPLASLAAQRLGIDPKVCELTINSLNNHKHSIVTQHGISTNTFTSTMDSPIHGPGQGGKGSSAIWMMISTLLMECMTKHSDGATFVDPTQEITVQQRMTGFVDDTTHWINNNPNNNDEIKNIKTKMEIAAQYWEQLLHASGGKLELTKCFFYHMKWATDKEGIPLLAPIEGDDSIITINDSETNQPIEIKATQCTNSHKTLGIMETPDGNNTNEYKRLLEKTVSMARIITTASLSKTDASTMYFTTYLPSITYSFTVGTQSFDNLCKIQRPVKHAILPKLGFNRNLPLEVAYGPKSLGGVGLRHLFTEQGAIKVMILLKQIRIQRPLGKLAQIKLAWDQRVAGIGHSILQSPYNYCPQLHHEKWTTSLREYLQKSDLDLHILNFHTAQQKRQFDKIIMDSTILHSNDHYTLKEIIMINRCRIYLKAESMADICNDRGTEIQLHAFNCTATGQLNSTELWPNQTTPGQVHIRTWKNFLRRFLHTNSMKLQQPLGPWTTAKSTQKWTAYKHNTDNTATIRTSNQWSIHYLLPPTRNGTPIGDVIHNIINFTHDPTTHTAVDLTSNASNLHYIHPYTQIESPHENCDNPTEDTEYFSSYLTTIPSWEAALISNIDIKAPSKYILYQFECPETTLHIVSDGSFIAPKGAYGWVIANDNTILIESNGIALGEPMTAYRSEIYGKLAWLLFIKHYTTFNNIQIQCKIRNFCDSTKVIQDTKINSNHQYASTATNADFDILIAIQNEQSQLISNNFKLNDSEHVQGHQDKHKELHNLTHQELLNLRADFLAKLQLSLIMEQPTTHPSNFNPHCKAYLLNQGNIISSKEHDLLRWKWPELTLQRYYINKFKIRAKHLQNINWAGMSMARNKFSSSENRFCIKLTTDWLPVGENMKKQDKIITQCHRCNEAETIHHLFACQMNTIGRTKYIDSITTKLTEIHTAPEIQQALIHGIQLWMNLPSTASLTPNATTCTNAQNQLGWNLLIKGLLAQQWSVYQQQYLNTNRGNKNELAGDTWNKNVSTTLIREAHRLWIQRCDEVHDNTSTNTTPTETKEIIAHITTLYETSNSLPLKHQNALFQTPITEHIRKGKRHMKQWIRRNTNTLKKMKQHESIRNARQLTLLALWGRPPRKKPSESNTIRKITNTPQSESTVLN
jgi:hypothetical protein